VSHCACSQRSPGPVTTQASDRAARRDSSSIEESRRGSASYFDRTPEPGRAQSITIVCAGAVRHSAGDGVSISFWSDGDVLARLRCGHGFSPRPRAASDDRIGGRGLGLIDSLVESWGASASSPSAVWFRSVMTPEQPARETPAREPARPRYAWRTRSAAAMASACSSYATIRTALSPR
jgi:hypothetical protein